MRTVSARRGPTDQEKSRRSGYADSHPVNVSVSLLDRLADREGHQFHLLP